jgi:hypothetical protein
MDWNEAIKEWQERIDQKYSKDVEYEKWNGETAISHIFELPEQDITIEYNGKPLIHVNGDYKPGCIAKAMAKTFSGKGKNRVEQEIESNDN